jgi:hypothetical protein
MVPACAPGRSSPAEPQAAPAPPDTAPSDLAPSDAAPLDLALVQTLAGEGFEPAQVGTTPAPPVDAPGTMLIVGDSGMVDLAPGLEASFLAAGVGKVVNAAWPGFGLTRPDFDWRSEWRGIVERERPAIVVVMLGGWDQRYLELHGTHAYGEIVNEALEVLMARGARVEWLAMLPGGGSYLSPVNTVYIQARDWSHSIDFFDAQDVLRSPDGSFKRTVQTAGGTRLVRKFDHWHFCPDGAELVAAAVHARLTELRWLPAATPGWEQGPWRQRADIYDNPDGACDPIAPA